MRKVLFRVSIIVLLFLLVVLGVAFYQDKTPVGVLRQRFGVTNNVTISDTSEQQKTQSVTDAITNIVKNEQKTTTGNTTTPAPSSLTPQDKQAAEALIDNIVIK